jgi:hypothetical protein
MTMFNFNKIFKDSGMNTNPFSENKPSSKNISKPKLKNFKPKKEFKVSGKKVLVFNNYPIPKKRNCLI